jgi:hypothetical protein
VENVTLDTSAPDTVIDSAPAVTTFQNHATFTFSSPEPAASFLLTYQGVESGVVFPARLLVS